MRRVATFDGRQCPKCGGTARYLSSRACVACTRQKAKQHYETNRTAILDRLYQDRHHPDEILFRKAQRDAEREQVPFTISFLWLREQFLAHSHCPVFDTRFSNSDTLLTRRELIRLYPPHGFTPENTRLVSRRVLVSDAPNDRHLCDVWRRNELTKPVSRETQLT